ncbi:hypothetical protein BRC86_02160 [Halobacteriales archaeon QS_3_64_16]|nr:MAG: hypothetical protein BRC86_02160 [Halobacteriales archaeon QS_3_64_16]
MKQTTVLARSAVALFVGALLLSAGASTALADGGASQSAVEDSTDQRTISDLTIDGLDVAIEDVHLTGDGLPEVQVEDRTYTVEERSVTIDGASVRINDAEIGIDDLTMRIEDSRIAVRNVTVGGE